MAIEVILRAHIARYPAMQIQDIYKLVHQAAMGSEHAISSVQSSREWLKRELAEMGTGPEETMIDPISPDGQIVRVHLRPFLTAGGDSEILLNAFIRTANEFHGDGHLLLDYLTNANALHYFPPGEMEEFITSIWAQNYPAVHHSPEHERLYRPAYQVVLRKYLQRD